MKIKFKYYISEFINSNDLDFSLTGSGLNSNCVALSGFALFLADKLDIDDTNDVHQYTLDFIDNDSEFGVSSYFIEEFDRVFEYAKDNNYDLWWNNEENRASYNLDFFTELKDK